MVTKRRMLRKLVSLTTRKLLLRVAGVPMKHPVRSDFDTAVTEAGINVTFKPTNSIYSFYRLAESEDVARLLTLSRRAQYRLSTDMASLVRQDGAVSNE